MDTDILQTLTAGRTPGEIALLLATAFIAGLARGFSGFGAALIFMPVASAIVTPQVAAPLILAVDIVMALPMLPDAWRRADRRDVGIMAIGALIGVPLGGAALALVDPLWIRWGIVAAVAGLLALLGSGWRYRGRPTPPLTIGVGVLSGLFSGAAQIGGPPIVVYWLGGTIPIATVRANIVLYFGISGLITAATYLTAGLIGTTVLLLTAAAAPFYGAGIYGGSRLFGLASDMTFRRICFGLIIIAAIIGLPVLDRVIR